MSRGNQILAGILVIQIALGVVFFWPRQTAIVSDEPIFQDVGMDQIVNMTIRDQSGQEIQLTKVAGRWVLADADDYPCKENAVPDLLSKLVALAADRLVTETRSSHKRLKVAEDDFASVISFKLADGSKHVLYLGTSPSYSVAHVRVEGQDQVYLVSGLSSVDVNARAASWVDTAYVTLAQDQVYALTIENAKGRVEFTKDDAGAWTMAGLAAEETLNENDVRSLVTRISSMQLLRPLGLTVQADYGLATPSAVVVARTRDADGTSATMMLHVGAQIGEDNAYVVKSSESPYYVQVAEYAVQDWVEKAREGFIALPPTPTPAPAP